MDKLIKLLEFLSEQIRDEKIMRYETILKKNKIDDNLAYRESELKNEISNEVDEDGKKKYSNETLRKAEFEQRSKTDEEYSKLDEKAKEIEKELNLKNIEISYLENRQKNIRVLLNTNNSE